MTQPFTMTQLIIDWLTSLGWNTQQEVGYPLLAGPLILDAPDRSVWITLQPGPGFVTDETAVDSYGFQAMTRGPADDQADAEATAMLLDQLILAASFPASVDGIAIQHADRLGSPPVPVPVDPNDLRHTYTCSYLINIGGV